MSEEEIQVKVLLNKQMTEKFKQIKERYALRKNAEVLRLCINEEHRRIQNETRSTPPLEHFNTHEDHVTIRDNRLGRYADVYPRPDGKLRCELCGSTDCEHVKFALTLPEVMKTLEKHGWKYRGRLK